MIRTTPKKTPRKEYMILTKLLDLVYPDSLYCICCGKIIDNTRTYRLCNDCFDEMKWVNGRICVKCGKNLSPNNIGPLCYSCRENEHYFRHGYTCCEYGQLARSVIFALKYNSRTDIARTIAEIMHDRLEVIRDEVDYDLIIPVPVHADRLRYRGYNQAALIAEDFARLEDKPWAENALIRTVTTTAMKGLTPAERRVNIHGAFELNPSRTGDAHLIPAKRILLLDDIITTGATADEISRVLLLGGAASVDVLSFASGADMVKSE